MNGLTDKGTNGQTDGQTDESEFIGRCPTNVECPIFTNFMFIKHINYGNLFHNLVTHNKSSKIILVLENTHIQ